MASEKASGPEPQEEHGRRLGVAWLTKSRIENLADGVFAIAMTILVLDLKVPKLVDSLSTGELWQGILALAPRFASYTLGFIVLGMYWVGHHLQFHFIRRTDRPFLWLNIAFLAAISYLPFPTAVLGEYPNNLAAVLFFGSSVFVTSSIFLIHFLYAAIGRKLVDENMTDHEIRQVSIRIAFLPFSALVGMLVSPISTYLSLLIYVSSALLYVVPGTLDKIRVPPRH